MSFQYLYLENSKYYLIPKSLDSMMSFLNPEIFVRANRQFIISKEGIKDITVWLDNRLLINLKTDVPEQVFISKNRVSSFKNWLMS